MTTAGVHLSALLVFNWGTKYRDKIQLKPSDAVSEIRPVGAQGINNQEEV